MNPAKREDRAGAKASAGVEVRWQHGRADHGEASALAQGARRRREVHPDRRADARMELLHGLGSEEDLVGRRRASFPS